MSQAPALLTVYDQPHQFEPLMPTFGLEALAVQARPVIEAAHRLQGAANESTRAELRALVRSMNSYYSNRIEGQNTHPLHIDQALRADFSDKPDVAKRQRLALAHIRAEIALEEAGFTEPQAFKQECLLFAHKSLYEQLSEDDRRTDEGRVVQPGVTRTEDVQVFRHQPPTWGSLSLFTARMDSAYGKQWGLDSLLIAAACEHHRSVWVHPFLDGNGRASRLQLHAMLHQLTGGLWSVNRGFSRRREDYYARLSEADMARQGDYDGRGNLSEKMLSAWCKFFIEICQDQVSFMTQMLDLDSLKHRLAGLIYVRSQQQSESLYRAEAVLPLHHILAVGPLNRGDFVQMTGLGTRTGRKVLSKLIGDGLLKSDTVKGPVRIGFPLDALYVLFPNLYPEAATTVMDV